MVDKHKKNDNLVQEPPTGAQEKQNVGVCDTEEQRALRQSERKFRMLFHNAGDAIFLWELRSGDTPLLIEANEVAARRLGYRLGDAWNDID